jgi:iron-sulfur cluster repair protein YtfE (RIC family)
MKSTAILELMVRDHTRLIGYLQDVENNLDDNFDLLKRSFYNFQWNLEKHIFVEERAIFLSYNPKNPDKDYTFFSDLMDQHDEIQKIIESLRKKLQEREPINLNEVKRLLVKHKIFEEKRIYPLIDQEIDDSEKRFIIDRINDIRL